MLVHNQKCLNNIVNINIVLVFYTKLFSSSSGHNIVECEGDVVKHILRKKLAIQ